MNKLFLTILISITNIAFCNVPENIKTISVYKSDSTLLKKEIYDKKGNLVFSGFYASWISLTLNAFDEHNRLTHYVEVSSSTGYSIFINHFDEFDQVTETLKFTLDSNDTYHYDDTALFLLIKDYKNPMDILKDNTFKVLCQSNFKKDYEKNEYDNAGNMINHAFYMDGHLYSKTQMKYDVSKNMIESLEIDDYKDTVNYDLYQYNKKNQLLKWSAYRWNEMVLFNDATYTYENDLLKEIVWIDYVTMDINRESSTYYYINGLIDYRIDKGPYIVGEDRYNWIYNYYK